MRILNWRRRLKPESLQHRIYKLVDPSKEPQNQIWPRTLWLDQGQTEACTGFSLTHVLGTDPDTWSGLTADFAQNRYSRAKEYDEWPGDDYDGSSVLGAMEAAKADGLITSYHWATTLDEVKLAVSHEGPLQIGIPWYQDMFTPDNNGYIKPTGTQAGGHAICIGGIDLDKGFLLYNSWGQGWGQSGNAWISFDDMQALLNQGGEFALPQKNPQEK